MKVTNDVFISTTCDFLREHGQATEEGCTTTLGDLVTRHPGSYMPNDNRISLDMTSAELCPHVYKNLCDTCATGESTNSESAIAGPKYPRHKKRITNSLTARNKALKQANSDLMQQIEQAIGESEVAGYGRRRVIS